MQHSHSWLRRNFWALLVWVFCVLAIFVPPYLLKTEHNPPVGVYIAIMGGLAAFVTFRESMKRAEKAGWIVLITLFIVAEIRSLYISDAEQIAKFSKISDALDATKRGLDTTARGIDSAIRNGQKQFQATMSSTNALLTESQKTIPGHYWGELILLRVIWI